MTQNTEYSMVEVAEYKKKIVEAMEKKINEYPVIALVNMENLPASQLQRIRAALRGKIDIFMTKKNLISIALKETEASKQGISGLESHMAGMPAMIFTKDSPFKLANLLRKNKIKAPIKQGQKAPSDIIIEAGPTGFSPGPIISELSQAGLKTRIDKGKIVIAETTTIAKTGEEVNQKKANVLAKLGIEPMEIGLDLMAAYEEGLIYGKEAFSIRPEEFIENLKLAATNALALTITIAYPTKHNITLLIAKAEMQAKALAGKEGEKQKEIKKELAEAQEQAETVKERAEEKAAEELKEELKPAAEEKPKEEQEEEPEEEIKDSLKEEPEIKIEEISADEIEAVEQTEEEKEPELEPELKIEEETTQQPYTAVMPEKPKEEKPRFEKIKTKISEDFKEDIEEEKERRERIDMNKIEDLAKQVRQRGTLRK